MSSFKFQVDASERKFVTIEKNEATKNHPGGVTDVSSHEKLARMYEGHGDLADEVKVLLRRNFHFFSNHFSQKCKIQMKTKGSYHESRPT